MRGLGAWTTKALVPHTLGWKTPSARRAPLIFMIRGEEKKDYATSVLGERLLLMLRSCVSNMRSYGGEQMFTTYVRKIRIPSKIHAPNRVIEQTFLKSQGSKNHPIIENGGVRQRDLNSSLIWRVLFSEFAGCQIHILTFKKISLALCGDILQEILHIYHTVRMKTLTIK